MGRADLIIKNQGGFVKYFFRNLPTYVPEILNPPCLWKMSLGNVSVNVSGKCPWQMSLENASGKCLWKMPLENVSGKCLWKMSLENVSGKCLWKSLWQSHCGHVTVAKSLWQSHCFETFQLPGLAGLDHFDARMTFNTQESKGMKGTMEERCGWP